MPNTEETELHFNVSSGLKSVLGSELITDDEVAIFELVKNSFDASAKNVDVYFDKDIIVIADDGIGMSRDDIQNKWLFVGYSEKRAQNRNKDYRNEIETRKSFAGSKGVGRLSSDRLGEVITLQTRARHEKTRNVHCLKVNWSQFDSNHLKRFEEIKVEYLNSKEAFCIPSGIKITQHGTVITIEKTRKAWDRKEILKLKAGLSKLINPFGATTDNFNINIIAPNEIENDKFVCLKAKKEDRETCPNEVINGKVGNFIFSMLRQKTTFIQAQLSNCGKYINSTLTDRGELIYKICEENPYQLLQNSKFKCELYFLNQSAKNTFKRNMGVRSVDFGSVFLFRNGFRVFPVGEEGDDWFTMERRKGQGFARFLGNRDVVGKVEVKGHEGDFKEASSRNTGLIETPAVKQLRDCLIKQCLTKLEKYVVPVTFPDKEDKLSSDTSRLTTDAAKDRINQVVAKLANNKKIELIDYSKNLIGILSERSEKFEASLKNIRVIAEKTKDKNLYQKIELAEKRFAELKAREAAARSQADKERQAKEKAFVRAKKAEAKEEEIQIELEAEKKRNLFLTSVSTLDKDTILNLHHQVTIYAVDIQHQIRNLLYELSESNELKLIRVSEILEGLLLLNKKILGVTKFATKANFKLQTEKIEADLGEYIEQYVNGIVRDNLATGLKQINVEIKGRGFEQEFKPIDVGIIIDNLISNSRKSLATRVDIKITYPQTGSIHVEVRDDGKGFSKSIKDTSQIFEKGFTTTDGSGLGLFHVRQVLADMNGTIEEDSNLRTGTRFIIKISS